MSKKPTDPATLRTEAEARVTRKNITLVDPQPGENLLHDLIHELKVHQIELEMQNEELRRTQIALEESRDRYVDLYEFAPVGYLTLTREGRIADVNLTGASLLGMERKNLLKQRFTHFVAVEDRERWHRCSLHAHQQEEKQSCELSLLRKDGTLFLAQLDFESRQTGAEPVLRLTLADITESKRVEVARHEAKRLAEATNSLSANIAILDETGTIIAVNRNWRTFVENNSALHHVNGCEGVNYLEVCDRAIGTESAEAKAVAAGIRAVMRGDQKEFELEYPCHSLTEKRWFIVRVTRLSGDGLACVVVSHENISARKQTEILLKQSELRYQGMLEDQTDIIARFKADGTVLYVNEACCRLYGKRSEEMVGTKWHPVVVQEDLVLIQKKLEALSPANPVVTIENRIVIADGTIRWGQFVNRAFYDEQGNLTEIQGVGRDITERKKLEETLVTSEREFRLLAEAMPQIVWITRPDGWNIYFNQQWADYTGLSLEESYGHGWNIPFHPEDKLLAWNAWQNAINNNGTYSIECRLRRADGEYRWWLIRGMPVLDDDGKIFKWFGTCTDIHENKKIEQALVKTTKQLRDLLTEYELSQETERKVIAREVHDELGQLLTTMRLNISMIRTRFAQDNPALLELVKDTTTLVDRAIHGVRNVTENLRPTVLGLGVLESIKWLRNDFVFRTGIHCSLEIPEMGVDMDEKRSTGLFRIVQESLTNVIRHAGKVHDVNISMELSDGDLLVKVKDDGRGFDLNNTKLQTSYGLLGMSERARALEGQLDIVSAPGKGTIVTVRIPTRDGVDKQ